MMDEAFVSLHAVKKLSSRKRCQDVEIGALEAVPGTELQGTMENTGIVVAQQLLPRPSRQQRMAAGRMWS